MMDRYRVIVAAAPVDEEAEDAEPSFVARVPEIAGCQVTGPTRAEALERLEEELSAQLENMREQDVEPPRPIDELDLDGEIKLKVSQQLHRDLLFSARDAGVELEHFLAELLARFVSGGPRPGRGGGRRDNRGQGGRGRRGGPQGQRYHNIMENRADFIEYVRQLDHEGGGGGGRGRGGRGGRGGR